MKVSPVVCFLLLGLLAGCSKPAQRPAPPTPSEPAQASSIPDSRFAARDVFLELKDDQGRMIWRLDAKQGHGKADQGDIQGDLQEVSGIFYQEGKPVLRFQSRFARADSKQRLVTAWGGVEARSERHSAFLRADKIVWEASQDKIIAKGNARVQWGEYTLRDERLILDTAMKRVWNNE